MSDTTRTFRALLWKDIRVNRLPLAVGLVLWLGAYGAAMVVPVPWVHEDRDPSDMLLQRLGLGVMLSTIAMFLGESLLAANLAAGERADRSAAFLAYLPPRRRAVLASKVVCGLTPFLVMLAINMAVMAIALVAQFNSMQAEPELDHLFRALAVLVTTGVLVFGSTWLCGVLTGSPAIATTCGLAAPVVLGLITGYINYRIGGFSDVSGDEAWRAMYLAATATIGVAFFAAGSAAYLRARPAV